MSASPASVINALRKLATSTAVPKPSKSEVVKASVNYPFVNTPQVKLVKPVNPQQLNKSSTPSISNLLNGVMAYVREVIKAVIAGDLKTAEDNVKVLKNFIAEVKERYGDEVASELLSRVKEAVGGDVFNALFGEVNLASLRPSLVTAYVTAYLRSKGIDVPSNVVKEVVQSTNLDLRKLFNEVREGVKELVNASGKASMLEGGLTNQIQKLRGALAVALGINGKSAIKMLSRSFKGKESDIFNLLAKSVAKPVSVKEVITSLSAVAGKQGAKAGTVAEEVKELRNSGSGVEGSSNELGKLEVQRLGKVMGALKKGSTPKPKQ